MAATNSPVALITGASQGLGRALASALAERGWRLVVDARHRPRLQTAAAGLPPGSVTAVAGDVTDPEHRRALRDAVDRAGRLDLLVNNASTLGPSPLPDLVDVPDSEVERVFAVNTFAPLALIRLVLDRLTASGGCVVNVSSDAAVEAYEGWGPYGAAKAALDHLTRVLAVERPAVRWYAIDPGDMATDLHQQAAPGEDISSLPAPESVVPALLRLLDSDLPSGRYTAAGLSSEQALSGAGR